MRNVSRLLLFLALLMQLGVALPASAADWVYTVRPTDKLWNLAEKYCGTHTRWRDIARHNQIANPVRLRPGSQIRFPLEWLIEEPAVVRVVYARGDVRVERSSSAVAGAVSGVGPEDTEQGFPQGAELSIGAKVVTGAHSYANVLFADGSSMQIGPDSEVQFDTLSAYRDTGMVDSRIRINRGSGDSSVERQEGPGSVYRIATPLGVAAVRGTEFRTRSGDGASFVETTGGAVEFIAPTGTNKVERGFGLKADASGVAVEQLLVAPVLSAPRTYGANERVAWQSLVGAAEYLVQIYSGPDLAEVLAQSTAPGTDFALASLGPGTYVLGVRGVAASGLQGLEATQTLTIQNALPAPKNVLVKQVRRAPDLLVSWDAVAQATSYRVVATPLAGGEPLVETTASPQVQLSGLALGKYSISVQANAADIEGTVSEPAERRVRRAFNWGLGTVLLAAAIVLL